MELLDGAGRGVVTTAELRRLGVGPAVLRTLQREGEIVRVARGTYARASVVDPDTTGASRAERARAAEAAHLLRLDALLRSYGTKVGASHRSAALVWGLPVLGTRVGDRVHLSYRRKDATSRRHDSFTIHRCQHDDAFTRHEGRAVVVPPLAVIGTAMVGGLKSGLVAADGALQAGLTTHAELSDWIARLERHPGLSVARAVLEHADGSAESAGESLLRLVLVRLGVRFETQHWIRVSDGRYYRVDFYLPDHGVVLEFDGLVKYEAAGGTGTAGRTGGRTGGLAGNPLAAEKSREDAIRADGFGVGRVVWGDLSTTAVAGIVRAAADQAAERARQHVSTPPPWAG